MKLKVLVISVLTICFVSAIVLWNYQCVTGEDLLTAGREFGIGYTELKLKDNRLFVETKNSFFDETTSGNYEIRNDTIFFEGYANGTHTYIFGRIEKDLNEKSVLNLYNENGVMETSLPIERNLFDD